MTALSSELKKLGRSERKTEPKNFLMLVLQIAEGMGVQSQSVVGMDLIIQMKTVTN